ncbi:unnamed protein product [Musa textilis]
MPAPGAAGDTFRQGLRERHRGSHHTLPGSDVHMESFPLPRPRERAMPPAVHIPRRRVRLRGDPEEEEGARIGEPEKATRSDILTSFTKLRDETGNPHSDKFLRDICVNFILAGRDTSSVALAWFFWLLSQHQEVEDRILKELREIVAEREGEGEGELVFKPEEVKKMEYLHAALREALRLYPSVPLDHKEVVEDDVFPDGTVVKKGAKVLYALYAMGRLESIWGKDCRDYKPERWFRNGRLESESAYKFPAFNGGPRLCLGRDFAYYQMKFVAASILHRYRVEVVADHPVEPKIALTLYMKHGLLVTLRRRDEA